MKPLSTVSFLRGSIRKVLPLALTVCLAVGLLYFMSMLLGQMVSQIENVALTPLENISLVYGGADGISPGDMQKIRENGDIRNVYTGEVRYVSYNLALGSPTTTFLFLVGKEDVGSLMSDERMVLTQGRMPEKQGEAVLGEKLAANNGLTVGSVVHKDASGWQAGKDVTVVGLASGPSIGIGIEDTTPGSSLILAAALDRRDAVGTFVEDEFGSVYKVETIGLATEATKKVTFSYSAITLFTSFVLILVLCFLLGNISMIQYTQRRKEFELLSALGYTRRYLAVKIFKEVSVSGILGYAAGILFAILAGWLMNTMMLSDKALGVPLVDIKYMLLMLFIPVFITLFGITAPIKMLRFRDIS